MGCLSLVRFRKEIKGDESFMQIVHLNKAYSTRNTSYSSPKPTIKSISTTRILLWSQCWCVKYLCSSIELQHSWVYFIQMKLQPSHFDNDQSKLRSIGVVYHSRIPVFLQIICFSSLFGILFCSIEPQYCSTSWS